MTKEQQTFLYKYLSEKLYSLDGDQIIKAIDSYDNKWRSKCCHGLTIRPYIEMPKLLIADDTCLNTRGRTITLEYTDGEYNLKTYLDISGGVDKNFSVMIRDFSNTCILDVSVSNMKDHITDGSFTILSNDILENQCYEIIKLSIDMMYYKINKFLNEECAPKDISGFIESVGEVNDELSKQS